jgi:hypothetical protein
MRHTREGEVASRSDLPVIREQREARPARLRCATWRGSVRAVDEKIGGAPMIDPPGITAGRRSARPKPHRGTRRRSPRGGARGHIERPPSTSIVRPLK